MNAQEILEKIVTAFNTGDVSEVDSIFSSNYIDHQKPEWLQVDGPEEFRQIVVGARKSLPNLLVTIKDTIIKDNKIVARLGWRSVADDGSRVERETIDILHLVDGKVSQHWGAQSWSKSRD